MYENISMKVKAVMDDAINGKVPVIEGLKDAKPVLYNQRETLRRINFYINDKYLERDDNAIFWNISSTRIPHFAKLISPDTKDFLPYGLGELNYWQSWALKKKVRDWFGEGSFYQTLNDTSTGLATYGSSVWKKYKDGKMTELEEVNLESLYFDQTIKDIKDSDIVENHNLTLNELWEKDGVWDNVQEVIEKGEDDGRYEVWEYYGLYQEEKTDKPEYKHVIGFGFGSEFITLWEETIKREDCPYYDFHIGKYKGRWLRTGVVERLFKLQERANQLVNQNAQTTEIASLLLLKSANADISGNVLEQAVNGQIIGDETLQQIGITNTGLQQFVSEMQMIENQADKLCLTPQIVQGESSPSNTTFRGIAVVNAGAVNAFRNDRQNFFEKIADILLKDIFPTLVKDWKSEDLIEMAEDDADVEAYDKSVKAYMAKEAMLNGTLVTPDVIGQIEESVTENIGKIGRKVVPGKDFWNFKWGFKMMPTDESVDKTAMNDTYYNALQMTAANPAITNVPGFKQYLEDNGIAPWKLTPKQIEQMQQQPAKNLPDQRQPDKLLAEAKIQ